MTLTLPDIYVTFDFGSFYFSLESVRYLSLCHRTKSQCSGIRISSMLSSLPHLKGLHHFQECLVGDRFETTEFRNLGIFWGLNKASNMKFLTRSLVYSEAPVLRKPTNLWLLISGWGGLIWAFQGHTQRGPALSSWARCDFLSCLLFAAALSWAHCYAVVHAFPTSPEHIFSLPF